MHLSSSTIPPLIWTPFKLTPTTESLTLASISSSGNLVWVYRHELWLTTLHDKKLVNYIMAQRTVPVAIRTLIKPQSPHILDIRQFWLSHEPCTMYLSGINPLAYRLITCWCIHWRMQLLFQHKYICFIALTNNLSVASKYIYNEKSCFGIDNYLLYPYV